MNLENGYLSDEEINMLIHEIEQGDLVMAPPDMKTDVLRSAGNKKREFVMYCFRVITSVAAAIAILLVIPGNLNGKAVPTEIPSREEVLKTQDYLSREEVLDETGLIQKIKKNIAILESNIASAIMMNENGGK